MEQRIVDPGSSRRVPELLTREMFDAAKENERPSNPLEGLFLLKLIMSPHADNLHGFNIFQHLINKAVLDIYSS
jgi:hypothetical protein